MDQSAHARSSNPETGLQVQVTAHMSRAHVHVHVTCAQLLVKVRGFLFFSLKTKISDTENPAQAQSSQCR